MKKILMSAILLSAAVLTGAEFHLVRESEPAAQFELNDQLDDKNISHLDLFNSYLKKVSGAELPKENKNLPYTIRIVLEKKPKLGQQHDWAIEFPSENVMEIKAAGTSLFEALNEILEIGADTRFLGVENCMFQYEPKKNISVPVKNLKSKTGFSLNRSAYYIPNHLVELGFYEEKENQLQYSHGIPLYAFPPRKYANGWPPAIMPVLRGKKITSPPANYYKHWQPCYSNPETAREAIKNILEILKKKPQQSITLGVNDLTGFCECEACLKMDQGLPPSIFDNVRINRSNSYFTFVNRVAEAVCSEYPDLLIGVLAYTGTIMPPTFPVHKNVVPFMTLDSFQEAVDPVVKERHRGVIRGWGQKVKMTGVWNYSWGRPYLIPRVNFKNQADFMKYLFANHGNGAFFEYFADALDGPKTYLFSRLLKDIQADTGRILDEWYARYAGKEAAPYLKEIYRMCEDYWTSEEMKKTPVYRHRLYVYMTSVGHMFALKPGFTGKLVDLAVKVRELARTPGEKARADILLRQMEYTDCVASFQGMAYRAVGNGEFKSARDVLAFFAFLETDFPRLIAQHRRAAAYFADPDFNEAKKDLYLIQRRVQFDAGILLAEGLSKTLRFIGSKEVVEGLKRIAALPDMPSNVKSLIMGGILDQGDKTKNYFSNPNLEKPLETLKIKTSVPYEISSEVLCNGQKTIKLLPAHPKGVPNPDDKVLNHVVAFTITQELPPGNWVVFLKVFTPAKQAVADLCLWPCVNGQNKTWEDLRQIRIPAGKWQNFFQFATVLPRHTGVNIILRPSRFKQNEPLYIGDIRLIPFGDASVKISNEKTRNLSAEKYALRGKSERGTLFGKTAVINRNPGSYAIAHLPFVWKHDNGIMEVTLNAARPPESKSGKLGVIIYGKKNKRTWIPKATVLWDRKLSNQKFVPVKFTVKGKMLRSGEQYLMIFFKMKGTEAAAISDAVMEFKETDPE